MSWPPHNYGLRGDALTVAREGHKRFGDDFEITSGRRTLEDQAAAMASNEHRAPGWIVATYVDSDAKAACVASVQAARDRGLTSRGEILCALLGALRTLSDVELSRLTMHLSGDAFDVRPLCVEIRGVLTLTKRGKEIADWLREQASKRGGRFLDREGGLLRLHWQARRR